MQSNKHSVIETITNVGSGFFISMILNLTFLPIFTKDIAEGVLSTAVIIGLVYTGVSMIRSFIFRRFFDSLK
jgi:tryptophan-rich sensory protein